jgi:hypothetical protein
MKTITMLVLRKPMRYLIILLSLLFVTPRGYAQESHNDVLIQESSGWTVIPPVVNKSIGNLAKLRSEGSLFASFEGGGLKTTDAGFTWEVIAFPEQVGTTFFFSDNEGIGSTGGLPPSIFTTSDGGHSWTPVPDQGGEGGRAYKFRFPSRDTGYAVGLSSIMRTIDGGKTWFVKQVETSDLYFLGFS